MKIPEPFSDYPESFFSHSRDPARVYRMRRDCFARRGSRAEFEGRELLMALPAENLCVIAGAPSGEPGESARPVYALSDRESPAVPTGRVFVQIREGADVTEDVRRAGYRIESVPPYAPQSAWLVARDGSIATALGSLEELASLERIVSVEPQMLRAVARRSMR